jgi:hypothetical protein
MQKRIILNIISIICIAAFLLTACHKEEETTNGPSIKLSIDSSYVYNDTAILIGSTFKVGIIAVSGDVNITNFMIKITTDSTQTYLDSGLNSASFNINKYLVKGVSQQETWTFIVRDKAGKSASLSIIISADSNSTYGPVITIPSITLGAQNHTTVGSFLDIKNVQVYNLTDAFGIQDSIEICYYYDLLQGENNVIASPNANIDASVYPGQYTLTNWTIRNETRYLKTTLTASDFSGISNDSLLIASYNTPLSKRKAKNLVAGDIYSFKTAKGKFGLFKVLNVNGTDSGTVEIMVKIQPY